MLDNSPTNAGGTAIYISEELKHNERDDIKFDFPNCEACFIDIECKTSNRNPIFGALSYIGTQAIMADHSVATWESFLRHLLREV